MSYLAFYLIGFTVSLVVLIAWLIHLIRKRRRKKKEIPQEVLEDFEEAERRLEESGGEKQPYTILWELARERGQRAYGRQAQAVRIREFPAPDVQRVSVSSNTDIGTQKHQERNNKTQSTPRNALIRRLRRK